MYPVHDALSIQGPTGPAPLAMHCFISSFAPTCIAALGEGRLVPPAMLCIPLCMHGWRGLSRAACIYIYMYGYRVGADEPGAPHGSVQVSLTELWCARRIAAQVVRSPSAARPRCHSQGQGHLLLVRHARTSRRRQGGLDHLLCDLPQTRSRARQGILVGVACGREPRV